MTLSTLLSSLLYEVHNRLMAVIAKQPETAQGQADAAQMRRIAADLRPLMRLNPGPNPDAQATADLLGDHAAGGTIDGYTPEDFSDEGGPRCRPHPNDWICQHRGGRWLFMGDGPDDPLWPNGYGPLSDGMIVPFCVLVSYPDAVLNVTKNATGALEFSWLTPPHADAQILCLADEWDTQGPADEFLASLHPDWGIYEPGELIVNAITWDGADFVFEAASGEFRPVTAEEVGHP